MFWALQLQPLADAANGYAWDAAQKRARLNYDLEQAKQFRSVIPVEETDAEKRARVFMERLGNPESTGSSRN